MAVAKAPTGLGAIFVSILAASNPIALDLIMAVFPSLVEAWPGLTSSDLVSSYLWGMAAGQIFAPIAIWCLGERRAGVLGGTLYAVSSGGVWFGLFNDLYLARLLLGVSSALLYLLCLRVIVAQPTVRHRARLYSMRTSLVMWVAVAVPLLSVAIAANFGAKAIFTVQAIYGITAAIIALGIPESDKKPLTGKGGKVGIHAVALDILATVGCSVLLYTLLSRLPDLVPQDWEKREVAVACGLAYAAFCYWLGTQACKIAPNMSWYGFAITALCMSVFVVGLLPKLRADFAAIDITVAGLLYCLIGVGQGVFAARAYSAKFFSGVFGTAFVSFSVLACSAASVAALGGLDVHMIEIAIAIILAYLSGAALLDIAKKSIERFLQSRNCPRGEDLSISQEI